MTTGGSPTCSASSLRRRRARASRRRRPPTASASRRTRGWSRKRPTPTPSRARDQKRIADRESLLPRDSRDGLVALKNVAAETRVLVLSSRDAVLESFDEPPLSQIRSEEARRAIPADSVAP